MWKWIISLVSLGIGGLIGVSLAYLKDADPGEDYYMLFDVAGYATGELRPKVRELPRVVVVNGREFEFGSMDVGEKLRHTFEIRNDGSAPLKLEIVRTTCKCAIGELTEDEIPPGETGQVTLEWEAMEYQTEYRQSATIESNDPSHSVLILSVFGRVVEAVKALPPNLVLGDATQNDVREASLVLYAFKDPLLEISGHEWLSSEIAEYLDVRWQPSSAEFVESVPGAKIAYEIFVQLKPGMPFGSYSETLRLQLSSSPGYLDVKVNGRIVSDISMVGAGYNERSGVAEAGLVRQSKGLAMPLLVLIKGPHRTDVQIAKANVDPADVLNVTIGESTSYDTVVKVPLTITIPRGAPLMQRRASDGNPGRIVLKTTHPQIPEIELDVSFAVVE